MAKKKKPTFAPGELSGKTPETLNPLRLAGGKRVTGKKIPPPRPEEVRGQKIDWSHDLKKESKSNKPITDLRAKYFGKLLIYQFIETRKATQTASFTTAAWNARCDCGNHIEVTSYDLKIAKKKHCGCGPAVYIPTKKLFSQPQPQGPSADPALVFARESLIAYACLQWAGYEPAAHHQLIAKYLEKVEKGEINRLMIFMPPRHGKSSIVSEYFPAWYLGKNPDKMVVTASYGQELASDFGRKVRNQIADPMFPKLFNGVKIADDSAAIDKFNLSQPNKGGYFAVGVGGALTGRGANCLSGDTLIDTNYGLIRIDEIFARLNVDSMFDGGVKFDVKVLSYSKETMSLSFKPIVAFKKSTTKKIIITKTRDGSCIWSTPEHLFYNPEDCSYQSAESMIKGDYLLTEKLTKDKVISSLSVHVDNLDVYDLQIEDNHNFFANRILVHNCLIIDDPAKSREDSDSESYRRKIKDWYTAVAYTRLMGNGAIVICQTRWHCLLPGSLILTERGNVVIEEINAGDSVITSEGIQNVQAAAKSIYSGKAVSIRINGYYIPLNVTCEHKILTKDGWKEAGSLVKDDWVAFPVPKGETCIDELISLFPSPPKSRSKRNGNTSGKHGKVTKERLKELLDTGKTYQEIAEILGYKSKCMVWEYAGAYGLKRPVEKPIVDVETMLDDPDFWRFVGYWLAEGCVSSGRKNGSKNVIRLTFSLKEQHFVDDVISILGKYGISSTYQKRKSSLMTSCSNKQLAEFLDNFGHGAKNKILPEWAVLLPDRHIKQMIKGYIEGDGTEINGWERVSCSSLSLLEGFRRALLKIGVPSSIMTGDKNRKNSLSELRFHLSKAPWLGYPAGDINQYGIHIENNTLYSKVKSVDLYDYEGIVYDIQTPCNDFVSQGMTVHNCDDLSGWLLKEHQHENWVVLNLPAINSKGEALWPERYPLETLLQIKKTLPARDWEALYQQKPFIEEGGIFKRSWWQPWPENRKFPECSFVIQAWDTATTDKDIKSNSYSARTTWGIFQRADDEVPNVILLEAWKARVEFPELQKEALRAYREYEPDKVLIEKKSSGQQLIQILRRMGLPLVEFLPEKIGDKTARAYAAQNLFENGRVYYPARRWAEDVIDEMARFSPSSPNDTTDSATSALIWLQKSWLLQHSDMKLNDETDPEDRDDEDDDLLPSNVRRFKPRKRSAYG